MTWLDWTVIGAYFVVVIAWALRRHQEQETLTDYYLAGRQTHWWQSGFSTMATQLGAISFVSAPAFVAMKQGGGLRWLCYEFGVPIGILLVATLILPVLHRGEHVSIYEYLERRYDRRIRTLISILFHLGRGLATAVSVLAGGLILSTVLPLSTVQAILIIGGITILYDVLGGLRVVILTDCLQMGIIFLSILACGIWALDLVGWSQAWQSLGADRLVVLDFSHWGLTSEGAYSFWPMTLGGIILYASYYGCDQSQVQRELSVNSVAGVRRSLLFNAFGRYPLVVLYCLMGVFVGAVFASPEFFGQTAATAGVTTGQLHQVLARDPDRMVPLFILTFLPQGLVGLALVGILAALMSSLDSAINSLSAASMKDFYSVYIRPNATDRHYNRASRVLTAFWGIFCIVAAIGFAGFGNSTRQTTIVLINAVGSLLYGPILATFLVGIATRSVGAGAMGVGVAVGIGANIMLWQLTDVSWLWWNAVGFGLTAVVALLLTGMQRMVGPGILAAEISSGVRRTAGRWRTAYSAVIIYFLTIITISWAAQFLG